MSYVMLGVAVVVIAFDFQNLLSLWWGKVLLPDGNESHDFTLIVPLFGDPKYFTNRENLLPFQANVLVALDIRTPLMAWFAGQLERDGWRVCRIRQEDPNPASLMKVALPLVTTAYVARLDADSCVDSRLPMAIEAVAASGADLCSAKVEAANPRTIPAKLQALEYRMAMLCRHFRPWLTSGACFVGKTESIRRIFELHSLWTPGEDIETGRIAHALRMKIRHADFAVTTDVPETWRALFKQRRLWWAGAFRHTVVNSDRNLVQLPVMTLYSLAVIWASFYFRWWNSVDWRSLVATLPMLYISYLVVTLVSNVQVASPWMLVFPFYALAQAMVLPPLGAITYATLAWQRHDLGRYRFGFRRSRRPERAAQPKQRRESVPVKHAPSGSLGSWAGLVREAA